MPDGGAVDGEVEWQAGGTGDAAAGAQKGLLPSLRTLKLSGMELTVSRDGLNGFGTPRLLQLTQLLQLSVEWCEGFVPSVLEALPGLQVGEKPEHMLSAVIASNRIIHMVCSVSSGWDDAISCAQQATGMACCDPTKSMLGCRASTHQAMIAQFYYQERNRQPLLYISPRPRCP